jgi:PPM family protein phosphatase
MKRARQAGWRGTGVRTGLARLLGRRHGRVATSQSAQREIGWEVSARSETGYVREENQDRMTCIPVGEDRIYVVADGMGGHKGGGLAAELTVTSVETWFRSAPSPGSPPETIRLALEAANAAVDAKAHCGDPDTEGMGSTAVLLLTRNSIAYVGHVGDSRAYLYRSGELRQLTKDHTRVQRMVDAGMVTPAEARDHPEGSILERAIGQKPTVVVDTGPELQLQEGDGILLCSDGLSGYVDSGEILAVLRSSATVQELSDRLVQRALDQGGYDNVTVQFIQYGQRAEVLVGPKYWLLGLLAPLWAFVRGLWAAPGVPTTAASTGEEAAGGSPPSATATSADQTTPLPTAASTGEEAAGGPPPSATATSADQAQREVRGPQAIAEEGSGKTEDAPPPDGSGAGGSGGQGP